MASDSVTNRFFLRSNSPSDGGPWNEEDYLTPSALTWAQRVLDRLEGHKGRTGLPDMTHSALLLVDLQRIFVDPNSPAYLPAWRQARQSVSMVLSSARKCGVPVYWSRHVHPASDQGGTIAHFFGRLIREESPWTELTSELKRLPRDRVLNKARHPVFPGTDLAQDLVRRGCSRLVIVGVQAPLCVVATAIWAGALDIVPVVVADAVAAKNEQVHAAALVTLAAGLAHVVTSAELLAAWENSLESGRTGTDRRN